MNYPESSAIKSKIDQSQKILVNCHHNPDADSVGSAVAMSRVLKSLNKEVKIVCPTELPANLTFLLRDEVVDVVDFSTFDFSDFDLFITLDSSSWSRVSGQSNLAQPALPFIVIDHHATNHKFGEINLIVPDAAANCEVLYSLFEDWNCEFEQIAEPLLAGIIGDTGAFRFPEAGTKTFEVVGKLMNFADKNKIIFNLYQSFAESHVAVWRHLMDNLVVDREHRFVYSFVRKDVLEKHGKPFNAKSELADMLFQSIDGTDFGLVGAEDEGYVSVSFRSRTGVDVSELAQSLGGGGHAWASAARVYDVNYDHAVDQILQTAREFAKRHQKS